MKIFPDSVYFFINSWTWGYEDILKAIAREFQSQVMSFLAHSRYSISKGFWIDSRWPLQVLNLSSHIRPLSPSHYYKRPLVDTISCMRTFSSLFVRGSGWWPRFRKPELNESYGQACYLYQSGHYGKWKMGYVYERHKSSLVSWRRNQQLGIIIIPLSFVIYMAYWRFR